MPSSPVASKAGTGPSASPSKARRGDVRPKRRRSRAQHVSLAPTARDRHVEEVTLSRAESHFEDPGPAPERLNPLGPKPKAAVTVNRRVDILEQELANKRI